MSLNKTTKTFTYGDKQVTLETGAMARQADGAVMASIGDTVVFATVVAKNDNTERDFFPLTVNYQEKSYAAGRIPGGYFKREGRPSEKETLIARLIDRPVRPLFPKGFKHEVQVIVTVLSLDPEVPVDIPALIAVSAALSVSGLPFAGPIGAARVAYQDGEYVLNPSFDQLGQSLLDLVVAGTADAVNMVESEAMELSEAEMLGAVMFGHEQMQVVINAISEFAKEVNKPAVQWEASEANASLKEKMTADFSSDIADAFGEVDKTKRRDLLSALASKAKQTYCKDEEGFSEMSVMSILHSLQKHHVREQVLTGKPRIDGRDTTTVRPINVETTVLPRVHGSAVFTRGETQALVTATLGTERDAQKIDDLEGDRKDDFLLHYNFPPYCVGEVGFMGSPKRREIGHGRLAKRSLQAVMPTLEEFPYVLRVVSEITESNGSSSMASVCGSSLALMDAGVPISSPVAGVAMGLILDGNRVAVLTDILGDEDHLGDMDFKVAGTRDGVTALQMDIKINGITKAIMEKALAQAQAGRLHILGEMEKVIDKPRSQLSQFAPRIYSMQIPVDKIRDVIGKGGATIRQLTESTNTSIEINDDGLVKVSGFCDEEVRTAMKRVEQLSTIVSVGQLYDGNVVKVMDFGAIVSFLGGANQGLVHISQISDEHVDNVNDYVQEGQVLRVKVIDIDRQGRIRLSMKQVEDAPEQQTEQQAESTTQPTEP